MTKDTSNLLKLEPLNEGKLLEGIFKYQKDLMDKYISLNRLPALPLDINTRENQKFLRKLIGDFNEELAEASSEVSKAGAIMLNSNYTTDEVQEELKVPLRKAAEELADALHFLVEIMIYMEVGPEDIKAYYRLSMSEGLKAFIADEPLRTSFNLAQVLNTQDEYSRQAKFSGWRILGLDAEDIFAASKLSIDLVNESERHCWRISRTLLLAQNCLKMKDWRAEEVSASISSFQEKVMECWIAFIRLVDLLSLDDNLFYTAYEKKNFICQQRIIDGY